MTGHQIHFSTTRIAITIAIVGWLGCGASLIWAASADRSSAIEQVEANRIHLRDVEIRLRSVEASVITTETNIQWIRDALSNHGITPKQKN